MSKHRAIGSATVSALVLAVLLLITMNVWAESGETRGNVSLSPVLQATLCVNPGGTGSCYNSIQAALDAAIDGSTIRVAEGTYAETVMVSKSLTMEGGWNTDFTLRDWDAYVTTIDAQRMSTVIRVYAGISPTIEGFVITGGDSSVPLGWGGGIWVGESGNSVGQTIIRHNVITNNVACDGSCQGHGGGILVYDSTAIIEYNTVISNAARTDSQGGEGGGIHIGWQAKATLTGNTVVSNTAVYSTTGLWEGKGGGLYLYGSDNVLRDNEIRGNVAAVKGTGRGGGMYAAGYHYDNSILNNTASVNGTGYGGGVYAYWVQDFNANLVQGNAASQNGDGSGGGIYAIQLQDAHHNAIVDNVATRGGGVYLGPNSRTTMRDNLIARNQATGLWGLNGGGGISSEDDDAEIVGNQIVSNTTPLGHGGGVLITGGDNYVLRDNLIGENVAYLGGGAFVYSATGTIAHNQVVSNAAFSGGGAYLSTEASPTMDRNVVMSNTAWGDPVIPGLGGAGLFVNIGVGVRITLTNHIIARNILLTDTVIGGGVSCLSGDVRLINNTVADNSSSIGGDGLVFYPDATAGTVVNNIIVGHDVGVWVNGAVGVLDYNDYYDNVTDTVDVVWGPNHRTDEPQFDDQAAGDYHLSLTSPLVDQGDNSVNVPLDFEGDPRPLGSGVDIGADEAYRAEAYVSAYTGNDITGTGSDTAPFATVGKGIGETRIGGTVYVGRGQYTERITVTRSVSLLGGYHEDDWSRDIAAHTTTLDAEGMGTVVVIYSENVRAIIEGFTITGGKANVYGTGGGILVFDAAGATIRYNDITGNYAQNGGGGLAVWGGDNSPESVVDSNRIHDNVADGVFPFPPLATRALLRPEQGPEPGGGLLVVGGPAQVVNNFIYSNTSGFGGDGMAFQSGYGPVEFLHNTIADNGDSGGEGIQMWGKGTEGYLYNNLIVGHGTGISATSTTQAIWDYNGFHDNTAAYAPGLTGGVHDVSGDSNFVDRAGGDLHISPASAMANKGADTGVPTDIDGDSRPAPVGTYPDLGADEVNQRCIYLPLVVRSFS
ncbi:MAG: hypothetical protein GY832_13045 [Chloroflexi bacterium]|nr:hypothetical protein [Chloroflexota bacterium]